MSTLPIESVLPELREKLRSHPNVVLIAPPGAGKTTQIPLSVLEEPWLAGRRILMLEPRRLAARSAARYMAASLGEQAGETVGYRIRMESRVGPRTRIEVITEGVLTRLLQSDPALEDVGLVIFDEFHERSLQADLGLALCLQSQAVLREDLRVLVMSATLDAQPVAALMGGAPVIKSEGRSFPVETRYLDRKREATIEAATVNAILQSLERDHGDMLVFLPGAGEIRRVEAGLAQAGLEANVHVAPLHGMLPQQVQDRAISPSREGERKIVLATSIAETSLTVEGVRIVIDSGQMRIPKFSPRSGMSRLETVQVSRSSADQRRGRAGRLGPGVCYRLWTEQADRQLQATGTPEILETDLASLALELAAWGVTDAEELLWLDPPPKAALAQAHALLKQLDALDRNGKLSAHGREMAQSGLHPRLAHMILRAKPLGLGGLACEMAALLNERDPLRGSGEADFRLRVDALRQAKSGRNKEDRASLRRILAEAEHWERAFAVQAKGEASADACGLLLSFAYPDRIALQRGSGRFLLRNGRGASFAVAQPLSLEDCLVAAELADQGSESRIFLAAPLALTDLYEHFGDQIEEERLVFWDRVSQAVRARKQERLGALVLKEASFDPDPEECLQALIEGIEEEGLEILPWSKAARQLQQRLVFMRQHEREWPDMREERLGAELREWLAPHLYGIKSRSDLKNLNLAGMLEGMLTWEQRRRLDEWAPAHIAVPSGSRIPIDYSDSDRPVLSVKLQEMFGLADTPRIAGGKVALTLHLLSPARRPVQVTRDLASFWEKAYFEVKKDLKGRYPKHYWPDDPLAAEATNRAKPRR